MATPRQGARGVRVTYRLEFELAGLPSTGNSHKAHWAIAGKERKRWRDATRLRTFMQRPPEPLTSCRIIATRYSGSEPDYDNLAHSFKSVIDGLKDAGVIKDDKPSIVLERKYLWERVPKKMGKIKVIVEEI